MRGGGTSELRLHRLALRGTECAALLVCGVQRLFQLQNVVGGLSVVSEIGTAQPSPTTPTTTACAALRRRRQHRRRGRGRGRGGVVVRVV